MQEQARELGAKDQFARNGYPVRHAEEFDVGVG
jgi:hypothetical protein